jgi:tail-anchored protein insertion receptor
VSLTLRQLWILYSKLPTPTSKAAREQIRLKREVVRLKRELNGVSAQDDFARWAKLRRQHDKVMGDFEKTGMEILWPVVYN